LIQADSGFYAHDFLNYLETEKQINYIVAVKMYPTIKRELRALQGWIKPKDGMEMAEFEYQSVEWKKSRRMVAVRKNIEILTKATGKFLLFDELENTDTACMEPVLICLLSKFSSVIKTGRMRRAESKNSK
jgi:hypothetical protein